MVIMCSYSCFFFVLFYFGFNHAEVEGEELFLWSLCVIIIIFFFVLFWFEHAEMEGEEFI